MYLCSICSIKNPNEIRGHAFEIFQIIFILEHIIYNIKNN